MQTGHAVAVTELRQNGTAIGKYRAVSDYQLITMCWKGVILRVSYEHNVTPSKLAPEISRAINEIGKSSQEIKESRQGKEPLHLNQAEVDDAFKAAHLQWQSTLDKIDKSAPKNFGWYRVKCRNARLPR